MQPPAAKRPSLKSRCCPEAGEPDERLIRRLRNKIGPTQLREILLGLSDPHQPWRKLCRDLMKQQHPALAAQLTSTLQAAYRELYYPSPRSDERDALLAEHREQAERKRRPLAAHLRDRVEAGDLPPDEAARLLERHRWQQVALAAVDFLRRLKHAAGLKACGLWLVDGSPQMAADFARLLCVSAPGARVVASSFAEVPASRLLVILRAVEQSKRKRLLEAALSRVVQLSKSKAEVTADLVDAAALCLSREQLANWCLRWLGQYSPDDPVTIRALAYLRGGGEATCADIAEYMWFALLLEEKMGRRDAHLRGQPNFTREVIQQSQWQRLQEHPQVDWATHAQLHYLISAAVEDVATETRILLMISEAQGDHLADIVQVLVPALGQRLAALVTQAVPLLPPEVAVALWIAGLSAHDETVRRECIVRLQALGPDALPSLLQAVEIIPETISPATHVLQALPGMRRDQLDRLKAVWRAAEGEGKAALSLLLTDYDCDTVAADLRAMYGSPDAVVRGAAAYCAPITGWRENLPGLICLSVDPHSKVAATARQSLLRWPKPEQLRPMLSRALGSRSAALRRQALYILGEGRHEVLLPLAHRLANEGLIDREDLDWAEQRLHSAPVPPGSDPPKFDYSLFRLPVRFANWRRYWHKVRRSAELVNAFHQGNLFGTIPDAVYLQMRAEMVRGHRGSVALYHDLANDLFGGLRGHFEKYHGHVLTAAQWDKAIRQALRTVDEQYLQEQWERGKPQIAINEEAMPQWQRALWWEIETQLLAMLPKGHARRRPRGFPGSDWGSPLEREWIWLSQSQHWYWGFAVRPRVPPADLAAFVRRKWRRVSDAPTTYTAQVVREILDYCVLWGHAFAGNKAWRQELRDALWACHLPLRKVIVRRETQRRPEHAPPAQEASPEKRVSYLFNHILQEWDPFHGSPEEPPLRAGLPCDSRGSR